MNQEDAIDIEFQNLPAVKTQRPLIGVNAPPAPAVEVPSEKPLPSFADVTEKPPLAPLPEWLGTPVKPVEPVQTGEQTPAPQSDADRIFTPLQNGEEGPTAGKDSWQHWLRTKVNGWATIEEAQKDLSLTSTVIPDKPPTETAVQVLRQNRNDPDAIAAFEQLHGEGSSTQYLRFAKGDHIALIAGKNPDPAAVEAFDQMYGPNMAYWYNMFASNDLASRTRAANEIRSMLLVGKSFEQDFETSKTGNFFRGIQQGAGETAINTANTVTWLSNGILGTSIDKIALPEEFLQQNPWLYTGSKLVTQIGTALGTSSGILGLSGGAVKGAGALATSIRGMQVGALADILAVNPDDPLLVELFDKGKQWSEDNLSKDEGARRLYRAVEGAGVGIAIDGVIRVTGAAIRFLRAAKGGNKGAAETAKEELANTIEEAGKKVDDAKANAKPAAPEPQQLDLPLNNPNKPTTEAVQLDLFNPHPTKTPTEAAREAVVGKEVATVERLVGIQDVRVRPPLDPSSPLGRLKEIVKTIPEDGGTRVGDPLVIREASEATAAAVEQFRGAGLTKDDLFNAFHSGEFSPTDLVKLQAMASRANKAIRDEMIETSVRLKSVDQRIKEAGNAATYSDKSAAADLGGKLARLTEETARYEQFDRMLGSFASKAMNVNRAVVGIVSQPANKVSISKLMEQGMSPQEIAEFLADVVQKSGRTSPMGSAMRKLHTMERNLNMAKDNLDRMVRDNVSPASIAAQERQIAGLQTAIEKQLERVSKLGKKAVDGLFKKMLNTAVELKLNALLYSFKTTAIVQYAGGLISIGGRTLSRAIGAGLVDRSVGSAIRTFNAQVAAFRSIAGGELGNVFQHALSNARKSFAKEGSNLLSSDYVGGLENVGKYVSNDYWGGGKVTDAAGRVVRLPGSILSFNDDLMGTFIARQEIAAEALAMFKDNIAKTVKALREKGTPEALKQARELAANPRYTIGGKQYTQTEFIQRQVADAFDLKTGRLNDAHVKGKVEEVLMKNPFESKFGQGVENALAHPVVKLLAIPFFRTPIRAIQMGFMYTPMSLASSKFRQALLGGAGREAQERAVGQFVVGLGWTAYLADKIFNTNEISVTGSGPANYKLKRTWEQSGWKANHVRIGDQWYDYSNLEPLSTAIKVLANIKQAYDQEYINRDPELDAKSAELITNLGLNLSLSVSGALFQAFTDSGMLAGLSKVTQQAKIAGESWDKPEPFKESGMKFAGDQVRSFIPAQLKQIADYMDPKIKDAMGPLEAFSLTLGNRDSVSNQYNVFGEPKYDLNPKAKLVGVFSSIEAKDLAKLSPEEKTLAIMGYVSRVTQKHFEHPTDIPELKGLDLRDVKSPDGRGTMFDSYMRNYRDTKIYGMTVKERLAEFSRRVMNLDGDIRTEKLTMPIGTKNFDGTAAEIYSHILSEHRNAAWIITKDDYTRKTPVNQVVDQFRKIDAEKKRAFDLNQQPVDRLRQNGLDALIGFGR